MIILDYILHLDKFLIGMELQLGGNLYILLFAIVFAETGLVITPFLPGDSLLFALGAMSSMPGSSLNFYILGALLFIAALVGDNVNYFIGKRLGPKIFHAETHWLFKRKYLLRAQDFYAQHGARAVIIARFIPIVRTFVPFVAGVGTMQYGKFLSFSVIGALLWIQIFLWAGKVFGNIPEVQKNFHYVILAVVAISFLPLLANIARNFYDSRKSGLA